MSDDRAPASGQSEEPATDVVYCEVCNLPHRKGVASCEDCGHFLGRMPDWAAIQGRRSSHALQAAGALALVALMLAINLWAFGGAGYVVSLAPFAWFVMNTYHYRVLSKCLARRGQ